MKKFTIDMHAFLRDACAMMHLLYGARAEEIVEFDPLGDDDHGICAEFKVEKIVRST